MATGLTEALELLVNETCLAMDTEVCSIYLADNDRRCYYLMATRGLKKPRGRTITLALTRGSLGWWGVWPSQLTWLMLKAIPVLNMSRKSKRNAIGRFSGCPLSTAASCLVCWWFNSVSTVSLMRAKSRSWSRWQHSWRASFLNLS